MAAEAKRQNAGTKVPIALPKSESTPSSPNAVSLEVALKNAIGARIRVTTTAPASNTLEGTLFTADPITNLIALQTASLPTTTSNSSFPSGSYRILPISSIQSFQLLALISSPASTQQAKLDIAPLNAASLQHRHATATSRLQQDISRQGPPGTTTLFQAIFDGLSRTYPIKWSGTSMLVSDSMIIEKPYLPSNVRLVEGTKGRVGEVERIKKVLDMERQKVALKGAKNVLDGRETANKDAAAAKAEKEREQDGRKGG